MRADARSTTICFLALWFVAGLAAAAWAEPVRPVSPLEKLESVQGAATVQKTGQVLVVTLPSQDGNGRWFRVEAGSEGASSFPAGFRAAVALSKAASVPPRLVSVWVPAQTTRTWPG